MIPLAKTIATVAGHYQVGFLWISLPVLHCIILFSFTFLFFSFPFFSALGVGYGALVIPTSPVFNSIFIIVFVYNNNTTWNVAPSLFWLQPVHVN
jgi:hypothetical protein